MDSDKNRDTTQEQLPVEKTISNLIVGKPKNIRDPKALSQPLADRVSGLGWTGFGRSELVMLWAGGSVPRARATSVSRGLPGVDDGDHGVYDLGFVFTNHRLVSERRRRIPGRDELAWSLSGPGFGSRLVVDYVLTISISIASGADAIFSFLPVQLASLQALVLYPVRGAADDRDEPARGEGIGDDSAADLSRLRVDARVADRVCAAQPWHTTPQLCSGRDRAGARAASARSGGSRWLAIFFRAYWMGGGTYTGIEAVSNGLPILREPNTGDRQAHHDVHGVFAGLHRRRDPDRLPAGKRPIRPG